MPRLIITQKARGKFTMPHYLLVNGRMLGLMRERSVTLEAPPATFQVRIQSLFKWFHASRVVTTHEGVDTHIDFSDREKGWDILFAIDLVLWIVKRFLHLAAPWTWIYEVVTNGYFVAWLVYEWRIRERYFKLDVYEKRPEVTLRDAREEDAPFLAKCVMAGMHFYDFEEEMTPEAAVVYERLVACERRTDLLYSYVHTRVAEVNGVPAGSLLSYPGEPYKELRHKTFAECWPDLASLDTESEMETGPGEYYLDTLAVVPAYRKHGIGHRLLEDAIGRGRALGYGRITLVADPQYPHLLELYASLGFEPEEKRRVFGVDFQRMVIECDTSSVD